MTVKTRANFQSGQATTFADNSAGDISAADLRAEMVNLSDSALFAEDAPYGLDADDIDDTSTTNKFATAAQLAKVDFLTVTGAVDLDNLFDGDAANLTGTISVNRFNSGTGASGSTYLAGDGTWKTPAGSGDVSKVGTPANNQVGIWTGDGTIEGDSNFVWTGTELDLTGDAVFTGTFVVIGNIGTTGTVDSRDIAADGAELDILTAAIHSSVADATALAAIPEADCANGMKVLVRDTGTTWRYVSTEDGSDAAAVFPDDDGDGTGAWLPEELFRLDFDVTVPTGDLPIATLGGNASTGDTSLFLNQRGNWAAPSGAITTDTVDPASAPSAAGLWWINTTSGDAFFSVGTSDSGDWIKVLNVNSISAISDLSSATSLAADFLMFEKDSDGSLASTTIANFITDQSIVTDTSTSTMTNKTLTNPKSSYTANALGTISSGTVTPSVANGNLETYTNGGAHTLAPPSAAGSWIITITNNGSAGTITTSGYTAVKGDSFTTTNTHKFICTAISDGTNSVLTIQALQ